MVALNPMWRSLLTQPRHSHLGNLRPTTRGRSTPSKPPDVASLHHSTRPPLLAPSAPPSPLPSPPVSSASSPPVSQLSGVSGGSSFKVFNVALDARKPLVLALRGVYGIGAHRARVVCGQLGVNPSTPLASLHASFARLKAHIEQHFQPRHIQERVIAASILQKVKIGSYAGIRHSQCLPVRGQRTQTNARTQRKLGRQRMIAYNIPAFNKKKPGSAGSKPQLATLAQQHAQQQSQQSSLSKQGAKKAV